MAEVSSVTTREARDRAGFANAIVISSDDDDEPPPASSTAGAGSSLSVSAPKRVKLEGGGSAPLPATAGPAGGPTPVPAPAADQPKPAGNDLSPNASFSDPLPLSKHPARLAGSCVLKLHALKGQSGTAYRLNSDTGRYEWQTTPAPQWLQIGSSNPYVYGGRSGWPQLHAMLQAANVRSLRVDDGTGDHEVLSALSRLANPSNVTGDRPLICLELQPPLPWVFERGSGTGAPLLARVDIWFEPSIFSFKISSWRNPDSFYYDVWRVMEALVPVRPPIPTPRPPPVLGTSEFALSGSEASRRVVNGQRGRVDAFAFTTAGLMKAMESAGYPEMADPPGLELSLYGYQRQTLQWMHDRETQPGGLNSLFWEARPSELGTVTNPDDGAAEQVDHTFYYNTMAGELRAQLPPVVTGGFLCEEMCAPQHLTNHPNPNPHPNTRTPALTRPSPQPYSKHPTTSRAHPTLTPNHLANHP